MPIIHCKECNKEVSDKVTSCPNCGAPINKPMGCGSKIVVVILGMTIIASFYSVFNPTPPPPPKTPEQIRADTIGEYFNAFDGSHFGLERTIKESLNDPDSYQHIKTTYVDKNDHLIVETTFRAKNKLGGMVTYRVTAQTDLTGRVIDVMRSVEVPKM